MELDGFRVLLQEAQRGDRPAQARLEVLVRPHLEAHVRWRAGPNQPEQSYYDWIQDVWYRFLKKLGQFRGAAKAGSDQEAWNRLWAWLRKVVHSVVANGRRRRARQPAVSLQATGAPEASGADGQALLPASDPTPSKTALSRENITRLCAALSRLPPEDRDLVQMRVHENRPWHEVAAHASLTVDQVKYRYRLILQRLRRRL
ncbi:MAG TPA: sigma-70 family RNA polymerase sigma factor [Gemmataceae bacterium]|nr:sigma-70 family RNA polymerase sigma factor [Gemmataceae bacterium]